MRRMHRREGREHEEAAGDFGRVPGLLSRLGFAVEQSEGEHETTLVAKRCEAQAPGTSIR
jgi:hypothetical protein